MIADQLSSCFQRYYGYLLLVMSTTALRLEGILTITLILNSLSLYQIQVETLASPSYNVNITFSKKKTGCKITLNRIQYILGLSVKTSFKCKYKLVKKKRTFTTFVQQIRNFQYKSKVSLLFTPNHVSLLRFTDCTLDLKFSHSGLCLPPAAPPDG